MSFLPFPLSVTPCLVWKSLCLLLLLIQCKSSPPLCSPGFKRRFRSPPLSAKYADRVLPFTEVAREGPGMQSHFFHHWDERFCSIIEQWHWYCHSSLNYSQSMVFVFWTQFPHHTVQRFIGILRVALQTLAQQISVGEISEHWSDGLHHSNRKISWVLEVIYSSCSNRGVANHFHDVWGAKMSVNFCKWRPFSAHPYSVQLLITRERLLSSK